MSTGRKEERLSRRNAVRDDWLAWLPPGKLRLFERAVHDWDADYAMLSVTLDEALTLLKREHLVRARQLAGNSADLCDRLAAGLLGALRAIVDHGRHFGALPTVAPLNPEFFRGEAALRTAAWNQLLYNVLLSSRSRFFHKLRALSDMVEELARDFREGADDLAEGTATEPETVWESLECLHYDLNTCLRETVVVFKSFLRALPEKELSNFETRLASPVLAIPRHRSLLSRALT